MAMQAIRDFEGKENHDCLKGSNVPVTSRFRVLADTPLQVLKEGRYFDFQKKIQHVLPNILNDSLAYLCNKRTTLLESGQAPIEMLQIIAAIRSIVLVASQKEIALTPPKCSEGELLDLALCLYSSGLLFRRLQALNIKPESFLYKGGLNALHVTILAIAQLEKYCQQRGWIYSTITLLATPCGQSRTHDELLENCFSWQGSLVCLQQSISEPSYHLSEEDLQDMWSCRRSISSSDRQELIKVAQRANALISCAVLTDDLNWLLNEHRYLVDFADQMGNTPLHLAAAFIDESFFGKMAKYSHKSVCNESGQAPTDMSKLTDEKRRQMNQYYALFNL